MHKTHILQLVGYKNRRWGFNLWGGGGERFEEAKLTKMIGTIFLQIGGKFPKMVPLLLPNIGAEMVPVLFVIFHTFLQ